MTRLEAEKIAEALREYVDIMAFTATGDHSNPNSLKVQRLAFEALRNTLIEASRHG